VEAFTTYDVIVAAGNRDVMSLPSVPVHITTYGTYTVQTVLLTHYGFNTVDARESLTTCGPIGLLGARRRLTLLQGQYLVFTVLSRLLSLLY